VVEHLAKVAAIYPAAARLASVEVFGFVFDWWPQTPAYVFPAWNLEALSEKPS
jgi:hypothetical protein